MTMYLRLFLVACLLLPLLSGCGDGRPERVPVSGTVTIDGEPVTAGYIRLIPPDARPAGGDIGPDGSFTLTTFEPNDGAVTGEHVVTVIAMESRDNGTIMRFQVPAKYSDPSTSDLTVNISEPTDSLPIELTWEGSGRNGPYEERSEVAGDVDPAPVVE